MKIIKRDCINAVAVNNSSELLFRCGFNPLYGARPEDLPNPGDIQTTKHFRDKAPFLSSGKPRSNFVPDALKIDRMVLSK